MIHTVRGFSVVNEAEVDVFLKLAFSMIQQMLAIWSLGPLPLLNPACTSGSSQFTYCWSLAWRIFLVEMVTSRNWWMSLFWSHSAVTPLLIVYLLNLGGKKVIVAGGKGCCSLKSGIVLRSSGKRWLLETSYCGRVCILLLWVQTLGPKPAK